MKFKKREVEIPWEEGAVLFFNFPSIPQMVKKYPELFGSATVDPKKIGKMAPAEVAEIEKKAGQNATVGGVKRIEEGLTRWKGIQDHEDKDIPVNDTNREWIIGQVFEDAKMLEKIRIAMGGPVPNSEAG